MDGQQTIKEENALKLADKTGVSDIFAFTNHEEITRPFPVTDFADPHDVSPEFKTSPSFFLDTSPETLSKVKGISLEDAFDMQPTFEAGTPRSRGFFEFLFGYNPEEDMPWGYEKLTGFERAAYRTHLGLQNIFTRTALGATKQVKGTLELILPKSMEQYLPTDTHLNEDRLQEDKFYEKRIQSELRKKKNSEDGITPEEQEELDYLDAELPSNWQRLPEFVGRVDAEVVRIMFATELAGMVRIPGGGTLNNHLSETGRRLLGDKLMQGSLALKNSPVTSTVLNTLSKQVEQLGPNAWQLFTWGFLAAEKPEEAERLGATRAKEGVKMTAWALLPLTLVTGAKGVGATKFGATSGEFLKKVLVKVTGPIADKLARMQAGKAKNTVIKQGLVEADDLFHKENGRFLNATEKKAVKKILVEVTDETSNIVKESADDIVAKIEELAGKEVGSSPVGQESVIPKILRSVDTVGDDVINNTTSLIEKKTKFTTLKQPNGNYAVLDKDTLREVAVNIKRKDLANNLDDLIFGVGEKAPKKSRFDVTKKSSTPRLIAEEVELKRSLKRMEVATNKAFRAGAKESSERTMVKVQNGKERLQTIKAGNREQWQNVEFARELVKEFVPKADQHLFMKRLIKAKTEGGLDKIFDDIGTHIDKLQVRASVDSIRSALKSAKKQFGDKTGKFAKARDEIRPLLETLDKSVEGLTKLSQQAGDDIANLGQLADEMVAGLNSAIAGKGQILGISETLADDLYNLTVGKGEKLTADKIETLAQLTRLVIHRAEQTHLIDIGGQLVAAQNTIDDSIKRILPRKAEPSARGLGGNFKKLYGVDSDHPITLVEKMFGTGSNMSGLLDDLYEGEIKAFGVMRNSYEFVKGYMRNNNLDDDIFNGLKKKVNVKLGGKNVSLARDDILGIAMSTRDPWVFQQMTKTSGYNIGGINIKPATTDELANMIALLTPEEMKIGAMIFELNNNYLGQVVNQTSLHLNGIKLFTYPQYYPSHRALNKKLYGNNLGHRTAETQSNFMPRMGGSGRMRFNPYSRELMDYIQRSANYHGLTPSLRSLKTVLGDKALQSELKNLGYADELSNLIDIISRSEGMYSDSSVLDLIGSDVLNRFTKGVLGGRVSTIGTQMASVPAAKAIIPSKYFSVKDTIANSSAIDDLMTSDFFWNRWTGKRISVELGDTASKSSLSHFILNKTPLTEKPLTGLIWGDKKAIGKIYLASKRFIADTTKLQGDDLTRAAIKLTEKATRETQPNWSILTRSKLASDPSVFKRSLTMFRTAQETQFNIWKRANAKFARSGKTKADVAELSTSYRAVLESQMSVALWKTIWKRGREAGVSGVAGWLGIYTPEDEDPFASDLTRQAARTIAGTIPLGQLMESGVESAFDALFTEKGAKFNLSSDPITTITTASVAATNSVAKWTKKWLDSKTKREGFTVDFTLATLDDILDDISTSQVDRKQKKQELINQISKDVVNAIRAVGLVSGIPVGPLDEWVAPGLKRSSFALVHRVNHNNTSDPAILQRDLHKFLTIQAELQKKSDKKGLTKEEAQKAFAMKTMRQTFIDPLFAVDDVVGDNGNKVLDSMSKTINDFLKEE